MDPSNQLQNDLEKKLASLRQLLSLAVLIEKALLAGNLLEHSHYVEQFGVQKIELKKHFQLNSTDKQELPLELEMIISQVEALKEKLSSYEKSNRRLLKEVRSGTRFFPVISEEMVRRQSVEISLLEREENVG